MPLGNARTFIRTREFLAVELLTDAGVRGWGEVFSSPWAAAALIRTALARLVLGQRPAEFGRIFAALTATLGYDRRGPAMMAISALDMALHDAAARERGVSVAALLGGALRDRVMAYASGPFIREGDRPYAHYGAAVEALLGRGFRAIKPRAGASPRSDGEMIAMLRDIAGPDVGLMVDFNQGYTARAAIESARRMEGGQLLWIEEPVGPEDLQGYRTVAGAVAVPVAGGEALASLAAFRDFLGTQAVSVLQPDLTVCGGYSGFQRIAHLAAAYDLPVMPHVFGTTINFHAALQMAALLPAHRGGGPGDYPYIEYDATGNPLTDLYGVPVGADGFVALPDGPGTGVEIAASDLEPWIVDTWSLACT